MGLAAKRSYERSTDSKAIKKRCIPEDGSRAVTAIESRTSSSRAPSDEDCAPIKFLRQRKRASRDGARIMTGKAATPEDDALKIAFGSMTRNSRSASPKEKPAENAEDRADTDPPELGGEDLAKKEDPSSIFRPKGLAELNEEELKESLFGDDSDSDRGKSRQKRNRLIEEEENDLVYDHDEAFEELLTRFPDKDVSTHQDQARQFREDLERQIEDFHAERKKLESQLKMKRDEAERRFLLRSYFFSSSNMPLWSTMVRKSLAQPIDFKDDSAPLLIDLPTCLMVGPELSLHGWINMIWNLNDIDVQQGGGLVPENVARQRAAQLSTEILKICDARSCATLNTDSETAHMHLLNAFPRETTYILNTVALEQSEIDEHMQISKKVFGDDIFTEEIRRLRNNIELRSDSGIESEEDSPDLGSPTLPDLGSPTLPDIGSPTLPDPDIGEPTLPDIGEPTLPDTGEPTLPDTGERTLSPVSGSESSPDCEISRSPGNKLLVKEVRRSKFVDDEAGLGSGEDGSEDESITIGAEEIAELNEFLVDDTDEIGDEAAVRRLRAAQLEELEEQIFRKTFTKEGIDERRLKQITTIGDDDLPVNSRILARRKREIADRDRHSSDEESQTEESVEDEIQFDDDSDGDSDIIDEKPRIEKENNVRSNVIVNKSKKKFFPVASIPLEDITEQTRETGEVLSKLQSILDSSSGEED